MAGNSAPNRHTPRSRIAAVVLLLFYMGMIFALSHQSKPPLPEVLLALSDKVLHAAEYLLLGFLIANAVGAMSVRGTLLAWGAATLFGVSDEIHQSFIPGRDASVFDVAADALGAALGVWAFTLGRSFRARRGPSQHPEKKDPS